MSNQVFRNFSKVATTPEQRANMRAIVKTLKDGRQHRVMRYTGTHVQTLTGTFRLAETALVRSEVIDINRKAKNSLQDGHYATLSRALHAQTWAALYKRPQWAIFQVDIMYKTVKQLVKFCLGNGINVKITTPDGKAKFFYHVHRGLQALANHQDSLILDQYREGITEKEREANNKKIIDIDEELIRVRTYIKRVVDSLDDISAMQNLVEWMTQQSLAVMESDVYTLQMLQRVAELPQTADVEAWYEQYLAIENSGDPEHYVKERAPLYDIQFDTTYREVDFSPSETGYRTRGVVKASDSIATAKAMQHIAYLEQAGIEPVYEKRDEYLDGHRGYVASIKVGGGLESNDSWLSVPSFLLPSEVKELERMDIIAQARERAKGLSHEEKQALFLELKELL